jgi:glycosyltransferase involved in cell wall biosynthesis
MSKGHKVYGFVDGCLRSFRIHSPVEESTIERLLKLSIAPSSGVYVIHHPPTDMEGRDFFREFRGKNPDKKAYVGYTAFETDRIPEPWVESCNQMDEIWVPSHFNAGTFWKAGVDRQKLHVIPHGFDPNHYRPGETEPLEIGQRKGFNFLSIFEWTYRKGWDILIRAYLEEFRANENVRLILRTYQGGGVIDSDVPPVVRQLTNYIEHLGFSPDNIPDIEFIENTIPSKLMPNLYKAADAFVLPTRGEGWGIPLTESILMEVPVIATKWSAHLEFMNHENSYLIEIEDIVPVSEQQVKENPLYQGHRWAEPSVLHARELMRRAFENRDEAREKGRIARELILNNFTIHHVAAKIADRLIAVEKNYSRTRSCESKTSNLNILFQVRPNIFTLPGGDTDVIINLKRVLEDKGIDIDISSNSAEDLREYNLVHIFNFDNDFAVNAVLQKKPYIVTPMYEDYTRYYLKSMEIVSDFRKYLCSYNGDEFENRLIDLRREDGCAFPMDYNFVATNAESILVSGESEGDRIRRDFPDAPSAQIIHLGFDRPDDGDDISPGLFEAEFGVKDFVLCVGRLETRKNQLMLLYALKDDDIPIVFINSRTVQPEYEELCRRFKRKGRTIFTGRLPEEMLYSAYRAARVHALPSWYELPGIVSLEAGWWGCNAVASDWGTIRDYLGDKAFYCQPDDPESIRSAILSALSSPRDNALSAILNKYTWEKQSEEVLNVWKRAITPHRTARAIRRLESKKEAGKRELLFQQLKGKANELLKSNPDEALKMAAALLRHRNKDAVLYYIMGTAALFMMNYKNAENYLKKAIILQPFYEVKAYLYLSLAISKLGRYAEAAELLNKCLRRNPFAPEKTKALIYEYLTKSHPKIAGSDKAAETNNKSEYFRNKSETAIING